MSDKKGGLAGAITYTLKTAIIFIVIPLVIFYSIPYLFDAVAGGAAGNIDEQMASIKVYINLLIICAIPLVVISFPLGYYARGDKRKIIWRVAYAVAFAALLWIVTHGGRISIGMHDVDLGSVSVSSFTVVLNNTILILVSIAICLIKGLFSYFEYRAYRDEFDGVAEA